MTALNKFTKTETDLLNQLLSGHNKSLEILIPDDLEPKEAVKWSKAAASLMDKKDGEVAALLHVMGRFHYLARINPKILEEADCKTIDEYADKILRCKQHRTTVYTYSSGYKALPGLTPDDAAQMGTENLKRATQIASKQDLSDKQREALIQKGKTLTVEQFKVHVEEESGLSAKGATQGASFALTGSQEQVDELKEHLADPRFLTFCETDQPLGMILRAIEESSSEWPAAEPAFVQAGQREEAEEAEEEPVPAAPQVDNGAPW